MGGRTQFVLNTIRLAIPPSLHHFHPLMHQVTDASLRKGLEYRNFLEAARESAEALQAAGCNILICLSHTGISKDSMNDTDLAKTALFDVVFSGHEHHYSPVNELPQYEGPGGRLGLLSQGMANGTGICWARLTIDDAGMIVAHDSGMTAIECAVAVSADNGLRKEYEMLLSEW